MTDPSKAYTGLIWDTKKLVMILLDAIICVKLVSLVVS
jgi:hypothetical protein